MATRNLKGLAADLLISLGVLALSLGAVSSVARRALFFSDNFADHVVASLGDPRVASFVAERMTDAILKENPDLTAFRPMILGTARGAVVSGPSASSCGRPHARRTPACSRTWAERSSGPSPMSVS